MTATERFEDNKFKGLLILLLFVSLSIKSCTLSAQIVQPENHLGIEGTIGLKTFTLTSDIAALNNVTVVEQGGQLGFIFGNEVLRTSIRAAGFYYSTDKLPHNINLFASDVSINVYPLHLSKFFTEFKVDPYLITGGSLDIITFYGHYLKKEGALINYSSTSQPYVGRINQTSGLVGAGFRWNALNKRDFLQVFAEARYGFAITDSKSSKLTNTSLGNMMAFTFGVSIGAFR